MWPFPVEAPADGVGVGLGPAEQATRREAGPGCDRQEDGGAASGEALHVVDEPVEATLLHAPGDTAEAVTDVAGVALQVACLLGVPVGEGPQAACELIDRPGCPGGAVGRLLAQRRARLVGQRPRLGAGLGHHGGRLAAGLARHVTRLVASGRGDVGRPVLRRAIVGDRLVCHGGTSSMTPRRLPIGDRPNKTAEIRSRRRARPGRTHAGRCDRARLRSGRRGGHGRFDRPGRRRRA